MNLKQWTAVFALSAVCMTAIPVSAAETAAASRTITLNTSDVSTFHDTNGDGLGEFEGWGTSLCWWANRVGYDEKLVSESARLFFSDQGLDMNIGRYNIGGGDFTGSVQNITQNPKAVIYDLTTEGCTPSYAGTSMNVWSVTALTDTTYVRTDADFGIVSGTKVGDLSVIGWINSLGEAPGEGDNLHYTVNVPSSGTYTFKFLVTLSGGNWDRNLGIRINDNKEYVITKNEINKNLIASANNQYLYLATIEGVTLNAGDNKVSVGGKWLADGDNTWTLDFVKMLVVKTSEKATLPNAGEFLHAPHITRSDSMVPGYAKDVTKIVLSDDRPLSWYEQNFARADAECGYAWNYDWDADKNQMAILKAAASASGEEFHPEAFSNSPPYFMTYSGCSSGGTNANVNNLRDDSYHAFAMYMADVIEHWHKEGVITFESVTPMNEPYTNYWSALSNKQEGCHFDQGESQSRIILELQNELKKKGLDIILSGTDETNVQTQISSYYALSQDAKNAITRIDTHTYSDDGRATLKELAQNEKKNLWMSEVDGSYRSGTQAGEMGAALGLAEKITADLNELKASAWIFWNAIDMHVDSKTSYRSGADYTNWDQWYSRNNLNGGYWGMTIADHDNKQICVTKKYYAYGQFSRYIRPGYTLIGSSDDTLAAYDPSTGTVVIVAVNTLGTDETWAFDLSGFECLTDRITAIRTSGSLTEGENWADVSQKVNLSVDTDKKTFTSTVKANSITTYIVEGVDFVLPFEDVVEADWFYDSVVYNYKNDLMTGMDPTHFGPYDLLSRAQFALILYRIQGEPAIETEKTFTDITGDEWYGPAVLWAAEAGIVNGYENGCFGPVDHITREQMAVMMYRYAKYLGKDVSADNDYSNFDDAEDVSEFAADAIGWAVSKNIINGKENGTLIDPQGNTARAETAAIIQRFQS